MKGQFSVPVIGIIVTFAVVIGLMVPYKYMSTPLVQVVKYEESHNDAQMTLITLLSSTENGRTIQQLIAENIVLNTPSDSELEQVLTGKLDELVESGCYKLYTPSKTLAESDCEPEEYEKETIIPLPYRQGGLTEKLTLVID